MATNSKTSLTVQNKVDIITCIEKGEQQTSVCERLNIPKTTINSIWKNRESLKRSFESSEFNTNCKRFRTSNYTDIDAALLEWFKQARNFDIPISGKLHIERAQSLATAMNVSTFTATTGVIDG